MLRYIKEKLRRIRIGCAMYDSVTDPGTPTHLNIIRGFTLNGDGKPNDELARKIMSIKIDLNSKQKNGRT